LRCTTEKNVNRQLSFPFALGGTQVTTWTYEGSLPGKEIRVHTGDIIQTELTNRLPVDTTATPSSWAAPAPARTPPACSPAGP
jgi:FtsP/CotA-like multicopper oxidase with cupredoxin domain